MTSCKDRCFFRCFGIQFFLFFVVDFIDVPNLDPDSSHLGLPWTGRSLFFVLLDNSYVGVMFLQINQPIVDIMVSRCPSSGIHCSSTCSCWVIGVNVREYSVAFFFYITCTRMEGLQVIILIVAPTNYVYILTSTVLLFYLRQLGPRSRCEVISDITLMHLYRVIFRSTFVCRDDLYLLSRSSVSFCVTQQLDRPDVMSSFSTLFMHEHGWLSESVVWVSEARNLADVNSNVSIVFQCDYCSHSCIVSNAIAFMTDEDMVTWMFLRFLLFLLLPTYTTRYFDD